MKGGASNGVGSGKRESQGLGNDSGPLETRERSNTGVLESPVVEPKTMKPQKCVLCTDIIEDRKCKLEITIGGETRKGYMCRECYKEDLLS